MRFRGLALEGSVVLIALAIIGEYVFIDIPVIGFLLRTVTSSWFPSLLIVILYTISLVLILLSIITLGATLKPALGFLLLALSWDTALIVIGRTPTFLRISGAFWLFDIFLAPAKVLTNMVSGLGMAIGKVYFPIMSVLTGSDLPLFVFLLAYPEMVGIEVSSLVLVIAITGMACFLLVDRGYYGFLQFLIIMTIGYIFGVAGLTFYKVPGLTEVFQQIAKLGPIVDPIQVLVLVFSYTMLTGDSKYWKIGKTAFSLYFLALSGMGAGEWLAFMLVFIGIPFFADILLGTTGVSLFSSLDFVGMSKIIATKSVRTIRITKRNLEREKRILEREYARRVKRAESLENRILLTSEKLENLRKRRVRSPVKEFVLKRKLIGLQREYEAEVARINEIQKRLKDLMAWT